MPAAQCGNCFQIHSESSPDQTGLPGDSCQSEFGAEARGGDQGHASAREACDDPKETEGIEGACTVIFRLSQRLSEKLKIRRLEQLPLDENPLVDWSAHVFLADRMQYILLSNTKSLLSALMPGEGITNDTIFCERALSRIRELLQAEDCDNAFERFIQPASAPVLFAKALDRRVTGSMNDLINHATARLAEDELPLGEIDTGLNDTLLSILARSKSFSYGKPREAFKKLIAGTES
jgi:hypothetical protein